MNLPIRWGQLTKHPLASCQSVFIQMIINLIFGTNNPLKLLLLISNSLILKVLLCFILFLKSKIIVVLNRTLFISYVSFLYLCGKCITRRRFWSMYLVWLHLKCIIHHIHWREGVDIFLFTLEGNEIVSLQFYLRRVCARHCGRC